MLRVWCRLRAGDPPKCFVELRPGHRRSPLVCGGHLTNLRQPLIGCSVILGGCMFNGIPGSGKIVTEPRTVSGFSTVSLSGNGQVLVEQTGTESLTVTTDDNLLPYVKADVHGGTLELGTKR